MLPGHCVFLKEVLRSFCNGVGNYIFAFVRIGNAHIDDLNVVAEAPVVAIGQPLSVLEGMDDWNREHHSASGLWNRCLESKTTIEEADRMLTAFLSKIMPPKSSPLCGNSIGQDRRFIYKYMPLLSEFLHYRNVDVSTLKELAARWYPEVPEYRKRNMHLALDDIKESVAELRHYRRTILKGAEG